MENIGVRTSVSRNILLAAFILLVAVIATGGLSTGLAQGSSGWAIDQTQQAVKERITSRESGRDLIVRFNNDARTEFKSNAEVVVRGTGTFSRNNDGKARNFSYEAAVTNRNSKISGVRYDWQGDWYGSGSGSRNSAVTNRLTGTYRLNPSRSDNPATVADRVTRNLQGGEQQRLRNGISRRLESPESLAFERNGRTITMASSVAAQITFEADGREQIEQSPNGRSMRTKATLNGERLVVSTEGDRSIDYQVTFEPIDNGRSMRITRRITDEGLKQPVVANSVYDKTSDVAQFDTYRGVRNNYPSSRASSGASRGNFVVPEGTQMVAVLNDNLSTKETHQGDRFALTVRSPRQYEGARIEGHIAQVSRSGQVTGRAEMSLDFDRILLRDGRAANFSGYIENVRTTGGETVPVDNEGTVQGESSQTSRTVTRTGIGAAIGAAVGAGAGAGSVFVQGREDLDLASSTEFGLRVSAPPL